MKRFTLNCRSLHPRGNLDNCSRGEEKRTPLAQRREGLCNGAGGTSGLLMRGPGGVALSAAGALPFGAIAPVAVDEPVSGGPDGIDFKQGTTR